MSIVHVLRFEPSCSAQSQDREREHKGFLKVHMALKYISRATCYIACCAGDAELTVPSQNLLVRVGKNDARG